MTPEELIALQRLQQLSSALPVDQPDVPPPVPPQSVQYGQRAQKYLGEATDLEKQAAVPMAKPQGAKENFVNAARSFLEGFASPHDPYAQQNRREDIDRSNKKDLVSRAQKLRDDSQQYEQFGQQAERDEFTRELANRPKPFEASAGMQYGHVDPRTGEHTVEGTVPTKPDKTNLNKGYRDRVDDKTGHVWRDYFEHGAEDVVTSSADLGLAKNVLGAGASQVTVQYTDPDTGMDAVGSRARNSNVIVPMRIAGSKDPVQGPTAGRTAARTDVSTVEDAARAENLYRRMQGTLDRINSGQSTAIGADDEALLAMHLSMTMGSVKGARTGRDVIDAHRNAIDPASRLGRIVANVQNGSGLTPQQRAEFVDLAKRQVESMKQVRQDFRDFYNEPVNAPAAPANNSAPANQGGVEVWGRDPKTGRPVKVRR